MDIERRFLDIINNNFKGENEESSFVICPKIFYSELTEREICSMQQIYSEAYNKAIRKVENKYRNYYI